MHTYTHVYTHAHTHTNTHTHTHTHISAFNCSRQGVYGGHDALLSDVWAAEVGVWGPGSSAAESLQSAKRRSSRVRLRCAQFTCFTST
jgi:hypothetical protein